MSVTAISYPLAVASGTTRIIEAGDGPAVLFVHGFGARAIAGAQPSSALPREAIGR